MQRIINELLTKIKENRIMTIEFAIISNNSLNIEILAFNVTNGKEIKEAYDKAKKRTPNGSVLCFVGVH